MRGFRLERLAAWLLGLSIAWTTALSQQPSPLVAEALNLQQQGRFAEAEKSWQAVTRQTPADAKAWANLGLVRALQEHYAEAVPAYRQALKLNPQLPGLQLDLGLALFKQQKPEAAIAPLKAAVNAAPKDAQPKILLGMAYYALGRYSEAIPYLQQAVTLTPGNLQLQMSLAQSCLSARQFECTIAQYKQILLENPDSAPAHILAAEAFDGLGRTNEAIEEFRAAAKADPNSPDVHYGVGYLLWKQRRFDEAETEFKLQLAYDPQHAPTLAYLGDIALKRDDRTAAMNYLQQAAALPQPIQLSFLDRGILYAELHQNEAAVADLQRAIRMDPNQPDAHWRLARLYRTIGRQKDADSEMAKVIELNKGENAAKKSKPPAAEPMH